MSTDADRAGPVVDARPLTGQDSRMWELTVPMGTENSYAALFRKAAELCELARPDSVDTIGLWWSGIETDQLHLGVVLHWMSDE